MYRQDQNQNSAANKNPSRARSVEPEQEKNEIEERLVKIVKQIEELRAGPCHTQRADTPETCDPAYELQVKAEAARWMLRVAKHLNGPTREKVFSTVKRSLDDLEKIVASNAQLIAGGIPRREAHAATGR